MNAGLDLVRSGQLLYTNDVGSDACGIGGVAAKDGKPNAEVVQKAMLALRSRSLPSSASRSPPPGSRIVFHSRATAHGTS